MGRLAALFRILAWPTVAWLATALAFSAEVDPRIFFRLPEGEAQETLRIFAEQAKGEFLFSNERVAGVRTRRVFGWYAPQEALDRMLRGSSLRRIVDADTGALAVDFIPAPPSVSSSEASASGETAISPPLLEGFADETRPDGFLNESPISLLEFVVTGSSIRGQETPVGSQLLNLPRDDIVAVGAQTTRDLISTVPQFSQFNIAPSPAIQNTEAPNLRNLGTGATLTLLNGHRMVGAGVGGTSADPSVIPLAAIQRIQVVPDGSSAIYGSDAVAGVINITTRTDLDGAEGMIRVGFADGYRQQGYSLVSGKLRPWGYLLLAYEYTDNTNLRGDQRSYVTNDLRSVGGADTRTTNTSSPNVVIGSTTYAYPALLPNTVNYRDAAKDADIVPENSRHSLLASMRSGFGERIEIFSDLTYSQTDARNAQPINTFNAFSFTMNDTNPYFIAPAGTDARSVTVNYSFGGEFGHAPPLIWDARAATATMGANLTLNSDWRMELAGSFGWGRSELSQTILDTATALTAVSGTTLETAFDPFTRMTNRAIMEKIGDTVYIDRVHQRLEEVLLKADGPLFSWSGGTVRAAVGIQARRESFSPTPIKGPADLVKPVTLTAKRAVLAAFSELLVPLAGPEQAHPWTKRLELSLAARLERYDSFGDTMNPKIGLNWEPMGGLLIRGSYGTSFRAPSLAAIQPVSTAVQVRPNFFAPGILTPPGMGAVNSLNIIGGNPDLGPEEATTRSIGFEFSLPRRKGLRFGATYYTVDYSNVVGGPQNRFLNPNLADTYIISPTEAEIDAWTKGIVFAGTRFGPGETGVITDSRPRNLRSLRVRGIDYELSQRWNTPWGDFALSLAGASYLEYRAASAPGAPAVDQLAQGVVRSKVRTGVSWRRERFVAGVAANLTGRYKNASVTPSQTVDRFLTFDANTTWEVRGDGWLKDTQLVFSVNNVLDQKPPRYLSGNGFNGALASPIGRLFSISLKREF